MRRHGTLLEVYDSRTKTSEALAAVAQGKAVLDEFAHAMTVLQSEVSRLGESVVAQPYARFVQSLSVVHRLLQWETAVRKAEVDADRFLRTAKVEAKDLARELKPDPDSAALLGVAVKVLDLTELDKIPGIAELLLKVPLPLPLFVKVEPRLTGSAKPTPEKPTVSVAFLSFALQDIAFGDPQTVEPELVHDLTVEVRVSHWPKNAEELVLDAVSAEPPDIYILPRFTFGRPEGEPPYALRQSGRMLLRVPQAITARPLEFTYRAGFYPEISGAGLVVEGQRQLRVQSHDPERNPVTGYVEVDQRLMAIRQEARKHPGVQDKALGNFLTIMGALGAIAAQALQDDLFPGKWSEPKFHPEVRSRLRDRKEIGSKLEEHPSASGGLTDLSFHGIRIELKVEPDQLVGMGQARKYLGQTSQYVTGSDKRLGVLCILDCSGKMTAPGSVSNDIALQVVPSPTDEAGVPLLIGVVIVRGNLPKPSDLSRS